MLLADDLDEDALLAPPVELAVEDLLPGPEVELTGGHRNDHFTAHHRTFDMRVSVVLACSVVMVLVDRFVWRQALEPDLVVVVRPFSSSLMKTEAVMCIALTRARPSRMLLSRRQSSTCGV